MGRNAQRLVILGLMLALIGTTACSQKRKPLVPLALDGEVKPQATALTEQGTQAYQAHQYEEAERVFRTSRRGGSAIRTGPLQLCLGIECTRRSRSRPATVFGSSRPGARRQDDLGLARAIALREP